MGSFFFVVSWDNKVHILIGHGNGHGQWKEMLGDFYSHHFYCESQEAKNKGF
jgi:hypothetical protein